MLNCDVIGMNESPRDQLELLQNLIKLKTENPGSRTEEIVNFLKTSVFDVSKGFRTRVITNQKEGTILHNIVAEIGTGARRIILCGHLDTVPAGDHQKWKHPPFSGALVDGNVYGRGTSDMKGGVVSLIGTIQRLMDNKNLLKKSTIVFAGTADEESGMSGAEALYNAGIMNNAVLLVIAEATNLRVGIAEKGVIWATAKVKGKAAHGSMPKEGLNAIEGASKLFPKFYDCLEPKKSELLGISTLNIGTMRAGTKINVVPEEAILELDYRLLPEQDPKTVIERLKGIDASPWKMEIAITHFLPPLMANSDDPFVKTLRSVSGGSPFVGMTYGTDAAKLIDPKSPIPFAIFGPGDSRIIHQTDEFVPLSQVVQASEMLVEAINRTFS